MTDERIDALIRRLDVPSDPDPSFVRTTYAALRPRARTARVTDASRVGRFQRDLRLVLSGATSPAMPLRVGAVGLVVLLILAAIAALAVVGALNRVQPVHVGPFAVSTGGELHVLDALDGSFRTIPLGADVAHGVSRSPNGSLIAFWTIGGGRSHLYVIGVDGEHRRELASDRNLAWTNGIDVWSPDSRFLATEVRLDGVTARIIVVDIATGTAGAATPPGLTAHAPLWSPDNRWIAFTEETDRIRTLAVIRPDGSDKRTISGEVVGVAGPDTWSPDGAWIYFDSGGGVYRANVAGGYSQRLTSDDLAAYAPASSPDGRLVAFIVEHAHRYWDLYVANSDGTGAHRLLEHAENYGWSADGQYVLAKWTPTDKAGGLAVVRPDGSEVRVVVPFSAECPPSSCIDSVGWGQPRP